MIVILTEHPMGPYICHPSDSIKVTFKFNIDEGFRRICEENILHEEVFDKECVIDYGMTFVFADKDGNCPAFHICCFVGKEDNLPPELSNAIRINQLSDQMKRKICESRGIKQL